MRLNYFVLLMMSFWTFDGSSQSLLKETRLDSISIFFESGSYLVKKRDAILTEINQIEKHAFGRILLVGYTDSIGSIETNQLLASRRIQSVREILKSSELKEYVVDTLNLNENRNKKIFNDQQFRRVDVLVYKVEPTYSIGVPVRLNIQFQVANDYVLTSSLESMKELLYVMKLDPSLKIRLNGHVCCAADQPLSLARAKRVKSFLLKYGIEGERITCFGYSNSVKLVEEISPENQAINRRVEVVFLKE